MQVYYRKRIRTPQTLGMKRFALRAEKITANSNLNIREHHFFFAVQGSLLCYSDDFLLFSNTMNSLQIRKSKTHQLQSVSSLKNDVAPRANFRFNDQRAGAAVQRFTDNRNSTVAQLAKFKEETLTIANSRLAKQHIRPWGPHIETLMTNSNLRSANPADKSSDAFKVSHPKVHGAVEGVENYRDSHNSGRVNSVMMITTSSFHKEFLKSHGNKEFEANKEFEVPNIHFITVQNAPKRGGYDIDKGAAKISFDSKKNYHHLEGFKGKRPVPANDNLLWKK